MQRLIDTISKLARLAFWPALAFALFMAVVSKPPTLPIDSLGDKFAHMLSFFTLTVLAGTGWPRKSLLRAAMSLSVVGAGIEVMQAIPQLHRDSDWRDWVADSLAILVAMGPVLLFRAMAVKASGPAQA